MTLNGNNSNYGRFAEMRAILLARASTENQEFSVPQQLKMMRRFVQREGIIDVDEIGMDGVSGSKRWDRDDINALIQRKTNKDDFELIIVIDASRFTRTDIPYTSRLKSDLSEAGLRIIYSEEPNIEGDEADVVESAKQYAINKHVKQIASGAARGQYDAIELNRFCGSTIVPFGADRHIKGSDNASLRVIRTCRDGSQLSLHPDAMGRFATEELTIDYYPPKVGRKGARFHKHRLYLEEFCPGDPDDADLVRRIFQLRYINNTSYTSLADQLNDDGILSPRGRQWSVSSLRSILFNPVYIGYSVTGKMTSAIFCRRAKDGPIQLNISSSEACKYLKRLPKENWQIVSHPLMECFLPSEVREVAKIAIENELDRVGRLEIRKFRGDRHQNSDYILRGILLAKHDARVMTGTDVGKYRYYRHPNPRTKTKYKSVSADKLEPLVKQILLDSVLSLPNFKTRLMKMLEDQIRKSRIASDEKLRLQKSLAKLDDEAIFIHRNQDHYREEVAVRELKRIKAESLKIEGKLGKADRFHENGGESVESLYSKLWDHLQDMPIWIESAGPAVIKRMLQTFIMRAEVDLDTKNVEMDFALPMAVFDDPDRFSVVSKGLSSIVHDANNSKYLILKTITFLWVGGKKGYYQSIERLGKPDDQNEAIQVEPDPSDQTAA